MSIMRIPVATYRLRFNPSFTFGDAQDIVPNHMVYDRENQMLMDVLENGSHSRHFPVAMLASEEET
jgi:maltooligosyltrehalose synthase